MATFKLAAGASIDLLTKGEVDESLSDLFDKEWTERARGIKVLRFAGAPGSSISGTAAAVLTQGSGAGTPRDGYVWALRQLGVGLSASVSMRVGIGDTGTTSPPNVLLQNNISGSNNVVFQWSGTQAILFPGEYLVLWASGAATVNNYTLYVVETPAALLWKLV